MTPSDQIDTETLKGILNALDKCILYMDNRALLQIQSSSGKRQN